MNDTKPAGTSSAAIVVGLCFAVAVLEGFDIQAMGVATPRLAPEFKLLPEQLRYIFSISNVGLVIGAAFGGRLADRWGRKPVFCASVITFGVFTLATAFVNGFETLFAARFCAGLGFGAALPNMMAVAAEISSHGKRSFTASMMFCGMPVGGATSALMTQVLPAEWGWRSLFVIGGVLPLVVVIALYALMPETLQRQGHAESSRPGIAHALFGERRKVPTLLLWLTFVPTLLILYLILNWLPTLVTQNGLAPAISPRASLAFNVGSVIGALLAGKLVDAYGERWPLTIGYVALMGALIGLSTASELSLVLAFSAAAGFFLLGANYSLYGVAAAYYPQTMRGTGSGASVAMGRVGSIIGPYLAGSWLAAGATATNVMQYMVPFAAVSAIAVFALGFFPKSEQ